MSATGIRAFDSTIQTTNIWLHELAGRLGSVDKQRAYHAMTAVLHALRDRLSVDQAVALGAQLPMLIRGFYYEGWQPNGKPVKDRKKEEFLAHIASAYRGEPDFDIEETARAVFQTLAKHVSPGEIKHVKITLPEEIRSLWAQETHSIWF